MVLPCQVWFDMEAPEAFERDDLDTIATTEQHLRTLARSEVRIESPREIPADSKFLITSAGTQKVEGEFAVRNVTKLTDAAGQLTGKARLRVVESSEKDCAMLGDSDDDDWPDGGYSCSWEGRQVEQQRESMAQVELRDESVRGGRRPAAVRCRDQYGCGEQRAAWRCAVVFRLDHVAHGKRLEPQRKCITRLENGSMAISLSDVFHEERRKDGCADDGGTGSFVGHERCGSRSLRRNGRRRDLLKIIQRCFREFWKKQGLKVRVLVLREATVSIRMSRVWQVWSGCEIQSSKRVRSKQEKTW